MSMRWSLYPGATYGHGSPQGVRSGYPSIGALLGALAFSQPSDLESRDAFHLEHRLCEQIVGSKNASCVWLACAACEVQIEVPPLPADLAGTFAVLAPPVLAQHAYVYVQGEIRTPGAIKYASGMTLSQAVTLAGGFTATVHPAIPT